jgi:TPR repeat protein
MKLQEIRAIARQRHISYDGLSKDELIRTLQRQDRAQWQEGMAAYRLGNYRDAFAKLNPLAAKGDVDAQLFIGVMYSKGQGVEQDFQQSLRWLLKAAEQGDAQAQSKLGVMYGNGQGVAQDIVQAHKWYSLAALAGNEDSRENRRQAERMMTHEQIRDAQKLAGAWLSKRKCAGLNG